VLSVKSIYVVVKRAVALDSQIMHIWTDVTVTFTAGIKFCIQVLLCLQIVKNCYI